MINKNFSNQINLMLRVLPEVARETCFALHGGTAINLFIRNMPRLSVDIDLTYLFIEKRPEAINNINQSLDRIKNRLESLIPGLRVHHKKDIVKLMISLKDVLIKLEVNLVERGVFEEPAKLVLCEKAQIEYDAFTAIQVVSIGQLYGGKICAALDRQHPRDIFDVKYLMENEGLNKEIITGFIFSLIGSERPIHEVLRPNLLDQRRALSNQFAGMSLEEFTYDDFEQTRDKLISNINQKLTMDDKQFIFSIKNLTPVWDIYNFEKYPSVKWKLNNLKKLKANNLNKYTQQVVLLEKHLFGNLKI